MRVRFRVGGEFTCGDGHRVVARAGQELTLPAERASVLTSLGVAEAVEAVKRPAMHASRGTGRRPGVYSTRKTKAP